MVAEKNLKLVLKQCDGAMKSNSKLTENSATKVGNKDSPNFPAAVIKVENEFVKDEIVLTRTSEGETSSAVIDESARSAVDYCDGTFTASTSDVLVNVPFQSNDLKDLKQFDFSQTDVVVKVEREEESNFLTGELVGCSTEDGLFKTEAVDVMMKENMENLAQNVSVRSNSSTDFEQFNCLQTTLCIKTEETVEEEMVVKNELVRFTVADEARKIADNDDTTAAEHVNVVPDKWKNGTKKEELKVEESLITSELVGRLPKYLEDSEAASITTFPKILKIILKRCDAATKSNTKQNGASKVESKDSPNFPAAPLKVENEVVLTQKAAKREESVMTENRPPFCRHCLRTFTNRWVLQQHLRDQTGETQCPARHCSVKFSHRCSLRVHLRSVHADVKPYACAQCPAQFFMKGHLKQHLFVHSSERTYACSQCPAKFKCHNTLWGHLKTHSQERRFGCVHCSCRFKGKNALKRHLNNFHLGMKKSFVCDQCPASFYRKDALKEHLLVHSKERAFSCHQCPAKFITASKLKRHVAVHSTERPFKCKTCPKSFKSHRAMQRHAKIHSGVNLHACNQCPAKFVAPFMLRDHKEGHSNNTATCELCSKTLKSKKALEFHLKNVHSSNRPYSCPKCPLTFLSLSRLKIHSTMHTGARRFGCAHCPAKFMKRDDLSRHLVVHAENKPFVCAHCLAAFSQRGALIVHLRRRHKESSPGSFPNKR